MKATKDGVSLTRKELRALREFASKEETDRDRYGVQICVDGEKVFARASNSRICIQFEGINDGHQDGEWFVAQKFLIDGRKELEGKQVLRLCFKGASLHDAEVTENDVVRMTLTSAADAAVAQASFPQISKSLKMPSNRRERVHCVAIAVAYMKAAAYAAEAVEEDLIEWFVPSDANGIMFFQSGSDKDTSVCGGITANLTEESAKSDEDGDEESDDEDEKPRRSRKRNPRQTEAFADAE